MNSVPLIHCHTQADKNTVPYACFMWETMLALAAHPEHLKLTVHCMGPSAADKASGWRQAEAIISRSRSPDGNTGSAGHGSCVMDALSMTNDGALHVIADSDTVMVAKGWDEYLRMKLVNEGFGIVGSTYEDLGGFSSGNASTQTYKKIPTLTWCALTPEHSWRTLDVMPNKNHLISIKTHELSRIYNLPQGYNVFGEVGWQIPQYINDNRLKYEGWRQLKPTGEAIVLKGLSDYHEEFHVGDRIPFLVHHRGSLRHAYRGDRISKRFYEAVDAYLDAEMKVSPRWTWDSTVIPPEPEKPEEPAQTYAMPPPSGTLFEEWLKVTYDGTAVLPKRKIDRNTVSGLLEMKVPLQGSVGHMRIEGVLVNSYPIIVPAIKLTPYMFTCRNISGHTVTISAGRGVTKDVHDGSIKWLLVDVDGVHQISGG